VLLKLVSSVSLYILILTNENRVCPPHVCIQGVGLRWVKKLLVIVFKQKSMLKVFRQIHFYEERIRLVGVNVHVHWDPVSHDAHNLRNAVRYRFSRLEPYCCHLHFS